MAALLLSFGLMMTGCDSGGDSDSNTGGGGGNEITIVQTTAGIAADGGVTAVKAVFTVTVNKDLAGKVATFTNVADDNVVYKPATADNTKAKQAAAIAVLFGDGGTAPAGAIYDVAYTASAEFFTLTQPEGSEGPVAEADLPKVTVTDAPRDVTGSLTATAAADDGKYVKLLVEGGDFDPNAAVYFKKDGTEILITSGTAPSSTDYTGAQNFTSGGAGKLISDAVVAVKASPTSGQLQQGDITLTLKADAYTGTVTAITAGFGGKVVVNANTGTAYTVGDGDTTNNTIKYTAGTPATVKYKYGTNAVAAQNLDPDFDGALIAVLSNLTTGDKVTFGAGGVIASAEFATAPTAAKITGAFGGTDELIISASTTAITTVTIPANKTLSAVAASLTTGGAATITVDGTLIVAKDGTEKVTITDAVITAGGAESALGAAATGAVTLGVNGSGIALRSGGTITTVGGAVLTIGATNTVTLSDATVTAGAANATFAAVAGTTAGTVTLGAGDTLVLGATAGGAITIAGTGKVVAGKTTIDGVGAWTASGGDVTITSSANGATLSGTAATLTASGTAPTITQNAGAGNALSIGAGVTVDLDCQIASTAVTVGSIKLAESTTAGEGGTISFPASGATAVIMIDSTAAGSALGTAGGVFVLNPATANITVSDFGNVNVHPGGTTTGKATKITGGTAPGTISAYGGAGGTGFVTIDANNAVS
jgi:hypothetical protein